MAGGECSLDPNHCYHKSCPCMITENHCLCVYTQGQPHYVHSSQQGTTNWLLRCTTQILQSNRGDVASTELPTQNSPMIKGTLYNHIELLVPVCHSYMQLGRYYSWVCRVVCLMRPQPSPVVMPTGIVSANLLAKTFLACTMIKETHKSVFRVPIKVLPECNIPPKLVEIKLKITKN